jgi:hypothetical protein
MISAHLQPRKALCLRRSLCFSQKKKGDHCVHLAATTSIADPAMSATSLFLFPALSHHHLLPAVVFDVGGRLLIDLAAMSSSVKPHHK